VPRLLEVDEVAALSSAGFPVLASDH